MYSTNSKSYFSRHLRLVKVSFNCQYNLESPGKRISGEFSTLGWPLGMAMEDYFKLSEAGRPTEATVGGSNP